MKEKKRVTAQGADDGTERGNGSGELYTGWDDNRAYTHSFVCVVY